MNGLRKFLIPILLMLLSLAAAQEEVRMDLQINLFMKILRYDRNIGERGKQGLKIGVLYEPTSKSSIKTWESFEEEFNLLTDKTINEIPIFLVQVKGYAELPKAIENYGINVLYICPALDAQLDNILKLCKEKTILPITGVPQYAEKGVAVGLDIKKDKPVIIINTTVAKDVGANFSADILKVAKVVK